MIVSDFDGTLLGSRDAISPRSVAAIRAYFEAGGVFAISTGRMYASVAQRVPELGLGEYSMPLMSFQGALVTDTATGEHIRKVPLDKSLAIEIAAYARERGVYCHVYSPDNIFIERDCETSRGYCVYSRIESEARYVGGIPEYLAKTDVETIKALMIDAPDVIDALCDEVNERFRGRTVFTRSADPLIECVDNKAGKGNAIRFAAARAGIALSDVIALGDSMNDYSMIKTAGLGIAMANADARLKAAADMLADSNDNDGVAKIIEAALNDKI
jgi:Cof subfamily protein (haloacid dehalogenase superfamily)